MNQQQQQRRGPAKPPMRGRGSRPPMTHAQPPRQQQQPQQTYSQRQQRSARGGRGRGVPQYQQQRNYSQQYQQPQAQTQQVVPQQAPQQQGGPQAAPRKRPPMKSQNNTIFAQFNAPQGQQPPQAQPMSQPPQAAPTQPVQPVQPQQPAPEEEKAMEVPPTAGGPAPTQPQQVQPVQAQGGGKPNDVQATKPAKKSLGTAPVARHQPPWIEFTGSDKTRPYPFGWAHRVRQVLSADTLRVALLKPRNSDPLLPPEIIQITLDGVQAPRCQRYDPTLSTQRSDTKKKQKKKKKQKSAADQAKTTDAGDNDGGADKDTKESPQSSKGPKPDIPSGPGGPSEDENYAFEAREFVRQKVMNKNIFYAAWRVNTNQQPSGSKQVRYWGDIYFQENKVTKSLSTELVSAGFARFTGSRTLSQKESERLTKKMQEAEKNKKGIWSAQQEHIRDIKWIQYEEQARFGDKHKGKTLRGIVDQVISGSTIRVEVEVDKKKNEYANVVVNIAGVNAPKVPQTAAQLRRRQGKSPVDKLSKPFGLKSKEWTEERLLGQVVGVKILFVSNKQIIAQIIHEKGRIGPSLLKKGLAQIERWSAKLCDPEEQKLLQQASEIARKSNAQIWGHLSSTDKSSALKKNEQIVTVQQVVSGDTLVVVLPNGKEDRFTLSSIRAPRLGVRLPIRKKQQQQQQQQQQEKEASKSPEDGKKGRRRGGKKRGGGGGGGSPAYKVTPDEYLARDAKEFVRRKCIGQQVKLIEEYTRQAQYGQTLKEKKFATVYVTNDKGKEENLALLLIKKGLVDLVVHGKAETNRSDDYALLEDEWNKQKDKKTGLYAFLRVDKAKGNFIVPNTNLREKKAKENTIRDYSGINETNIKTHELIKLNQYLKGNKVEGVVEFIFGANRVKVFIPKQRVCIAVRLANIRVGDYSLDGPQSQDPFRDAATKLLNQTILQRDIVLEITSTGQDQAQQRGKGRGQRKGPQRGGTQASRNPNLDGHIYLDGQNISEELLKRGLAQVITYRGNTSYNRQAAPSNFIKLQEEAQKNEVGLWKNWNDQVDDVKDDQIREQRLKNSKTGKEVEVVVSHIESASVFYVNDANSDAMQKMCEEMEKLAKQKVVVPKKITPGKVRFAAKYDGYYARARVRNRDRRQQQMQQGGKGGKGGRGKKQNDQQGAETEDEQNWFVMFIDYGNKASISRKQFAELPAELRTTQIPPLAMRCELAGISVYRENERSFNDAGYFFSQHAFQYENQKLRMKILYDDQNEYRYKEKTWYVELFVGDKSINQLIAREGFVTLTKDNQLPDAFRDQSEYGQAWSDEHKLYVKQYFDVIKANINLAKDEHKNIWYHGDVGSEEEDNLGPAKGAGGGRKR